MEFIKRTYNFKRHWLWFKKFFTASLIISIGSLIWLSADSSSTYSLLKYLLFSFLALAIITSPVDDLAVDSKSFFYFKKSIFPLLSKVEKFEISKIKNIRSGGMLTQSMDILEFFTFRGGRRNTIEITFVDDSYKSLDVAIYREELNGILTVVKGLVKSSDPVVI